MSKVEKILGASSCPVRMGALAPILGLLAFGGLLGQGSPRFTVTEHRLEMSIGFENSVWYFIHKNELQARSRVTLHHDAERPVHSVPVILNRLLSIRRVQDDHGRLLAFRQSVQGIPGWTAKQINLASLELAESLNPGESITIEIDYMGSLAPYTEAGQIFVQERLDPKFTIIRSESFGYPHIEWPSEKYVTPDPFRQHLEITLPEGFVAASGHPLLEKRSASDGKVTWVYESLEPMFQIIVPIAKYAVEKGEGFEVFYFPEDEEGARRVASGIRDSMDLMTSWFGPLVKKTSFAVAEIPEGFGSQALRPTVIQTAAAFNDPKRMVELYHEIAHFWDLDNTDTSHPRWNEGLAMFLMALVAERLGQTGAVDKQLEESRQIAAKHFQENPQHRDVAMVDYGKRGVSGLLSYSASAVFFGILHQLVGHERFTTIMADYRRRFGERGATTAQFVEHWNERTGGFTTRLFQEWFGSADYVDLILSTETFPPLLARYRQ